MDWEIRIALIVAGLIMIGVIVFDYQRRKKKQEEKQRLIQQMRQAADQVDPAGFDAAGVGNVRKVSVDNRVSEQSEVGSQTQNPAPPTIVREPAPELVVEPAKAETSEPEQLSFDASLEPELVCSLILRAADDAPYRGSEFMPLLLSQGLRHGEMGIFHRHGAGSGKPGPIMYSVANAVKPGTFELKNIETFTTPAFAFFTTLPGPKDPKNAYESMVKTVRLLKDELGGQILDSSKSVYTEQTHQHQLEIIQDFVIKHSR